MKKVMVVFGTRPEAIKMCPLVKELKKRDEFEVCVLVTGQHKEMLRQVLDVFEIKEDYNLSIMKKGQSLFDVTTTILDKIKSILEEEKPDIVLVHGDTSTSFVAGLAAFYLRIPVGHVEAGLRTYNKYSPYPEEFNRQAIGSLADFHFAPTTTARDNLLRENKDESKVFVTGNTVIDALQTTVRDNYSNENLIEGKKMILLTMHRRENLGESMKNSFRAIKRVVNENEDIYVIYPIHLNPKVREIANEVFDNHPRIKLIEPLNVVDFHNFMKQSFFVMTDSGGIQEEAPALGKPVLVMRDTTERPEGVEAGTLKLTGLCEEDIYNEMTTLLSDKNEYDKMSEATNPYGDGHASERICDILSKNL
ncbi:UDP-N-acetylglucosamine 2-epimerase (non-hydrolyzing) [Finegoldia dalianensis]|uniref:UDP-N-acetylglucosamine 2-epimerase (non-hydrolyzing) n=1 Tax=Finegoldia dalianensis TaxID=3145239 RepID=A0ABW9KE85_9FIRM